MARLLVSLAIACGMAACTGPGATRPPGPTPATASSVPTTRSAQVPMETPPGLSVVPQSLLDEMLAQVSETADVPVTDLSLVSAEAVTWPDGSLGCPEPGMMYTQVLVDGYRVVISARETTYDFRGTGDSFRLCENSGDLPRPTKEAPPPNY